MEFQASSTRGPAALCFPLLKFSYATVSGEHSSVIPWIHIPSKNDLFVTFDMVDYPAYNGTPTRRQRFRVLQDPTIMEDIDVELLATEAQKAALQAQSSLASPRSPYVTIIARDPCIAMRYPISNGQVRRFQIRFAQQSHYYQVMGVLTKAGIPISEAGVPSVQTPPLIQNQQIPPLSQTIHPPRLEPRFCDAAHQDSPQLSNTAHRAHLAPADTTMSMFNLTSSQPQPVHPPVIDLYTPRPSTAPEAFASTSYDSMPPRRELPFVRKASKPDVEREGGQEQMRSINEEHLVGKEAETLQAHGTKLREAPKTNAKSTTRKRAATKPRKPPATKKTKSATVVKKLTATLEEQHAQVSAEVTESKNTETASLAVISQPVIDTQALLTMAENKLLAHNHNTRLKDNPPNSSPDMVDASVIEPEKNSKSQKELNGDIHNFPTGTDRNEFLHQSVEPDIHHEHTTGVQDDEAVPKKGKTNMKPRLQSDVDIHETEGIKPLSPTLRTPVAKETVLPLLASQAHDSCDLDNTEDPILSCLGHKAITDATAKLAQFSSMSKQEQHQALESFICRTIDDDNFITLCKSLDGVWQKALCLKR